jgi:hypothetical protein
LSVCDRYCKGSPFVDETGGLLVNPIDAGPNITPRYSFETALVPEPPLFNEDVYKTPVPLIDKRPISFAIQVYIFLRNPKFFVHSHRKFVSIPFSDVACTW